MMRQLLLTLTAIEFSECPGVMGSIDVSNPSSIDINYIIIVLGIQL
jgi:hypothetical protein